MLKKTALICCGWLCIALGALGAFLPLLPTTPFLLLASGCFMRGSPRLNHWLNHHPRFGPVLQNWHQHGAISPMVKKRANVMIVLSFFISICLVPQLWHKGLLCVVMTILLVWFNRLPVRDNPENNYSS
ncbi:hypothetical protein ABT56_03160 [Photobacterium aquae]|uniref:Inner membrane protein n=1 Tax=Photobacterium aquae TaxID=1195763 RepID=A0A0J1HC26_9GAMM|nr:YbaN family protein [Photobacterium aquae]KLV09208.1 hypothetical protein ABT56_03160 [Photobacterium aquae]